MVEESKDHELNFLSMREYFTLDKNWAGNVIPSTLNRDTFNKSRITDKNFRKYLSPENLETLNNGVHKAEKFDFIDLRFFTEERDPPIGIYWTKIQLYNYFLDLAKKIRLPKRFNDPIYDNVRLWTLKNLCRQSSAYVLPTLFNIDLKPFFNMSNREMDPTIYKLYRLSFIYKSTIIMLIKLAKKILKKKKILILNNFHMKAADKLYAPGYRLFSKQIDKLNTSSSNESIKHLTHCYNISHNQLQEIMNLIMSKLSVGEQRKIMGSLIDKYGKKYKKFKDKKLKNRSGRILLRMQKYELCQFMEDMGLKEQLLELIEIIEIE